MMKTVESYELISPHDKIMVAISGGKDSYTLLDLPHVLPKKVAISVRDCGSSP